LKAIVEGDNAEAAAGSVLTALTETFVAMPNIFHKGLFKRNTNKQIKTLQKTKPVNF